MNPALEAKRVELEAELASLQRQIRSVGRELTDEENERVAALTAPLRQRLAAYYTERMIGDRPEVVSRGKPVSGDAAQRGLEEARSLLAARPCASACPAAQMLHPVDGSVALRCAIEGTSLSSKTDPQSLLTFCIGTSENAHEVCPTWQTHREAEAAGREFEGAVL